MGFLQSSVCTSKAQRHFNALSLLNSRTQSMRPKFSHPKHERNEQRLRWNLATELSQHGQRKTWNCTGSPGHAKSVSSSLTQLTGPNPGATRRVWSTARIRISHLCALPPPHHFFQPQMMRRALYQPTLPRNANKGRLRSASACCHCMEQHQTTI